MGSQISAKVSLESGEFVSLEPPCPIILGPRCDIFVGTSATYGKVVLKRLRLGKELESQTDRIRRIQWEATQWKRTDHPRVLKFIGVGIDLEHNRYLLSPWQENGTIMDYVKKYPQRDRRNFPLEIAEGLGYLHDTIHIIHGNLCAQNILVSSRGQALIRGFGVSRSVDQELPANVDVEGICRLKSPEMLRGSPTSKESDVFSFGMTIYQVLSGKEPYADDLEAYQVNAVIVGKRPPEAPLISEDGKSYKTLWEVAKKCWDGDPLARPRTSSIIRSLGAANGGVITQDVSLQTLYDPENANQVGKASIKDADYTSDVLTVNFPDLVVSLKSFDPQYETDDSDIFVGTFQDQFVALKSPKTTHGAPTGEQKPLLQFKRELAEWPKLRHPNILEFLGEGTDSNGRRYLGSPWMENGTLWGYIIRNPHCNRRTFLYDIAEGIAYLHNHVGLVHGDIRSDNVLVTPETRAVLCDFGLSRPADSVIPDLLGKGTLSWQSPELLRGEPSTFASDVYAFGITIYEVLSGQEPFRGQEQAHILHSVLIKQARPPKSPPTSFDDISYADLWDIAERCWEKEPASRPVISKVRDELKRLE